MACADANEIGLRPSDRTCADKPALISLLFSTKTKRPTEAHSAPPSAVEEVKRAKNDGIRPRTGGSIFEMKAGPKDREDPSGRPKGSDSLHAARP